MNAAPLASHELWLDTRLGNTPQWVIAPKREAMRIHPTIEKCVVFLASNTADGMRLRGTAFLLVHPLGYAEATTSYLVTARHVVEGIQKTAGGDGHVYMRFNSRELKAGYGRCALNAWTFHDDDRVDVAAMPLGVMDHAHAYVPLSMFATDKVVEEQGIGVGTQLFFPGLFVRRAGEEQNLPIVRFGNIAAMPGERIKTKWGNLEAYLVEARSIGGLSGSPVFATLGPVWIGKNDELQIAGNPQPTFLLGLVHGHWDTVDVPDSDSLADDAFPFSEPKSVNMGIGIVVPAKHIQETLDQPYLSSQRDALRIKLEKDAEANLPVADLRELGE